MFNCDYVVIAMHGFFCLNQRIDIKHADLAKR